MKKIVVIVALLLGVSLYGQKKGGESWCRWHAEGPAELSIPADNYEFFKKGNFYYYLSNDDRDLYINLKIEDSGVQYKILQEGMNVWINPEGKNIKKTGFRFPVGAKYSKAIMARTPVNNANPDSPLAMANTIELIGFPPSRPRMVPADGSENLKGSVNYSKDGDLFYSLCIPLAEINMNDGSGGKSVPPFSIGIEYGVPPENPNAKPRQAPQAQGQADNFSSASGRGGGSRGGGGRGGGRSSGASMPMGGIGGGPRPPEPSEASTILWVKNITIATQN
jgi:uncharacterized membrane protein YgcG